MFDCGKRQGIRKAILLCACFSITCLLMPATVSAERGPVRRVLPNGMTVILDENHAAPVVTIQVWVKAGSAQERDGAEGVAHLHEHMLFKGTQSRGVGSIAREVEAAGGQINAYTSWDMTVYYVNMASRFMNKGIDILADIVENATFDAQELDIPVRRLSETFF